MWAQVGNSTLKLTIYDVALNPEVTHISPPYGDVSASAAPSYTLTGKNFAPTGTLKCRFGFDASGDVEAMYISPVEIRCGDASLSARMALPPPCR